MLKIGVFSGSFDPPTKGHEWIIETAHDLFDEFYVLVGYHPRKTHRHDTEIRLVMLRDIAPEGVFVDSLGKQSIRKYLKDLSDRKNAEITLVRGIRNKTDFEYEKDINHYHSSKPDLFLKQIYLIPPPHLENISSSQIREKEVVYKDTPQMKKARKYYKLCLDAGIIQHPTTITGDQVRKTLDPYPFDVVSSEIFTLMRVDLYKLQVNGDRYQPCSASTGPVMVDLFPNGPTAIEGKHRVLDARKRGEKDILCYVGDLVIEKLS